VFHEAAPLAHQRGCRHFLQALTSDFGRSGSSAPVTHQAAPLLDRWAATISFRPSPGREVGTEVNF
jgi:hypothetical protein